MDIMFAIAGETRKALRSRHQLASLSHLRQTDSVRHSWIPKENSGDSDDYDDLIAPTVSTFEPPPFLAISNSLKDFRHIQINRYVMMWTSIGRSLEMAVQQTISQSNHENLVVIRTRPDLWLQYLPERPNHSSFVIVAQTGWQTNFRAFTDTFFGADVETMQKLIQIITQLTSRHSGPLWPEHSNETPEMCFSRAITSLNVPTVPYRGKLFLERPTANTRISLDFKGLVGQLNPKRVFRYSESLETVSLTNGRENLLLAVHDYAESKKFDRSRSLVTQAFLKLFWTLFAPVFDSIFRVISRISYHRKLGGLLVTSRNKNFWPFLTVTSSESREI